MDKVLNFAAIDRATLWSPEPRTWVMSLAPLVWRRGPDEVLARRKMDLRYFLPPQVWCVSLPEAFAADWLLHAEHMPDVQCPMSRELLTHDHVLHLSRHLPLARGAALRLGGHERPLLCACAPEHLTLDSLKRWLGALLLACEAHNYRSLAVPMPPCNDDEDALIIAGTLISEARGHHGLVRTIWPVFADAEQRDRVVEAIDEWLQEDLENFESASARHGLRAPLR